MIFLKTKEEIENWLDSHNIENYTLIADNVYGFVVSIVGSVNLSSKNLTFVPIKFSSVSKIFRCDDNKLNSLEFCPDYVGESFYCDKNELKSLIGSPKKLGFFGMFDCSNNQLKNLEGAPKETGNFYCNNNQLISLKGSPQKVTGNFDCSYNKFKNLNGLPKITVGLFNATHNEIDSLNWLPKCQTIELMGNFKIKNNETGSQPIHFQKQHLEDKENFKKEIFFLKLNKIIKVKNKTKMNKT